MAILQREGAPSSPRAPSPLCLELLKCSLLVLHTSGLGQDSGITGPGKSSLSNYQQILQGRHFNRFKKSSQAANLPYKALYMSGLSTGILFSHHSGGWKSEQSAGITRVRQSSHTGCHVTSSCGVFTWDRVPESPIRAQILFTLVTSFNLDYPKAPNIMTFGDGGFNI